MDFMHYFYCVFSIRTEVNKRWEFDRFMSRKLLLYLIYHLSFFIGYFASPLSKDLPEDIPQSPLSITSSQLYTKSTVLQEFRNHDITVPAIFIPSDDQIRPTVEPGTNIGYHQRIYMTFTAFNKDFKLDLQLNLRLFGSEYTEKSIDARGEERYHSVKQDGIKSYSSDVNRTHCYYIGHVVGVTHSSAAISTCNGVRGYITIEEEGYHIEPVQSPYSITGQHYVLRESDYIIKNLTCGQTSNNAGGSQLWKHSLAAHQKRKRSLRWPYDANDKTMLVELYIANDFSQYNSLQRDTSEVIRRTKDIVNIVSSLYRPLNMYVALVGVEVWVDGDKIEIVDNADKTMNNFLDYRRNYISPKHRNDNAQLITGRTLGDGVVGKAPIMTICTWQYSGGVNLDHSSLVGPVATTVAHELGHNFGLTHDVETCACPQDRCIMAPSSGGQKSPTKWSECSLQQFADGFHQGMDYCLHNLPEMIYGGAVCGNGFTEAGEQCDCGLAQDCTNPCCNASTCKLVPNASCSMGECCDTKTCQLKPISTPCRPMRGPCDLSEHCNGENEYCPDDVFRQDGTKCTDPYNVLSYCFQGKCQTSESQCRLLWGTTGHTSHKLCYEHFNIMGTANGHCGFNWVEGKTFKKCELRDTMCGMLHCTHRNEKLMFWKEALAYTLPEAMVNVNNTRQDCKGVILDVGLDMPDPGMVPNGAKCGESKMCINRQCLDIDSLGIKHCPDCHNHGVCNSLAQCHCDAGYAPPYCDKPGNGGSLQSGPVAMLRPNVGLIVGMCFLFLFLLPVLCVISYCSYKHRDKLKRAWLFRQADKYRSVYRATPRNDAERPSSIVRPTGPPPSAPIPVKSSSPRRPRPKSVMVQSGSVRHPPPPPAVPQNHMRRAQSFRPQDISDPLLKSCTNQVVCQTVGVPKPSAPDLPTLTPSRHAPAPPPPPGSRADIDTPRRAPKRPPQPQVNSHRYSNQVDSATPRYVSGTPAGSDGSSISSTLAGSNTYEPMENFYEEIKPLSPNCKPPEPPDSRHRFYSATPHSAVPTVTTTATGNSWKTTPAANSSLNRSSFKADDSVRPVLAMKNDLSLGRSKSSVDSSNPKESGDESKPSVPRKPSNSPQSEQSNNNLVLQNKPAVSPSVSVNNGVNSGSKQNVRDVPDTVGTGKLGVGKADGKISDSIKQAEMTSATGPSDGVVPTNGGSKISTGGVKPSDVVRKSSSNARATSPPGVNLSSSNRAISPTGAAKSISPTRPAAKTSLSPTSKTPVSPPSKSTQNSTAKTSLSPTTKSDASPTIKPTASPTGPAPNKQIGKTSTTKPSTAQTSKTSVAPTKASDSLGKATDSSSKLVGSSSKTGVSNSKPIGDSKSAAAGRKVTPVAGSTAAGPVAAAGQAAATRSTTAGPKAAAGSAANPSTAAVSTERTAVPTEPTAIPTRPAPTQPTAVRATLTSKARASLRQGGANESQC